MFYENILERGFAYYTNPSTNKIEFCFNCHISLYPDLHKKVAVRKEQFVLAEIQRQIPELEEYFMVWDCALNSCTRKKPDMCWGVKETLIHVEIDENGDNHEDDSSRLLDIHGSTNFKNHVVIRFNPDSTEDGREPCFKSIKKSGENMLRLYQPEWDRRIPELIHSVKNAFHDSLENKNVCTKKRKLFF